MTNILTLILLFILVACVGFFSSSETAYLSLQKLKVRRMLEEGRKHAKIVARLKSNMENLLTVVLVGTNFLNSFASALATALAIEIFGSKGAAIAPIAASFFMSTFGQIIPKTAAGLYPEKFALSSSLPLLWLEKIFYPIVWVFSKISHVAVVLVEKIIKPTGTIVTEEELKTLIDVGSNEGTIEKDESYLLNKIIKFNDLKINDVMKHRSLVSMIKQNASYQEVKEEFQRSGFSTLTVYSGSRENVVGVLNYKKLLFGTEETNLGPGYAARHMVEVLYIPGTLTVFEVLQKFRYDEYKFAVVLDEQDQTDGIITMEDIMKVVFGHMSDENTYDDKAPEDKVQLISLNTFIVPGDMKLDDVNEILDLKLESDEMNTIGGWLLEEFGYLPNAGNVVIKDKNIYTVEEVEQRRISSVRIKKST